MNELYEMIFKRKSVRQFDPTLVINTAELAAIEHYAAQLQPLIPGILTEFKIVDRTATTAKFGTYCLLAYSEDKPGYLLNIGYQLEQLDLYLASINFGACWYGMGKPVKEESADGYVIMLAFGKATAADFRTNSMEFKRKPSDAVWQGAMRSEVMEAVRLAPSATNSQPWRFTVDDHRLTVFRDTAALSIIPPSRKPFFNTIDVGISLCFLELALTHAGLHFERTITKPSRGGRLEELAVYQLDQ